MMCLNAVSIICTTTTAENKEELLYLKTLKAGISMKNESESVFTALYMWIDWLHHPANVFCFHWRMYSEKLWKVYDSVHQEKGLRPEKLGKDFPWVWLNLQ